MEQNVQELLNDYQIPKLADRSYWFVRTDSGAYFDDFIHSDYIAIGWDYLTLEKMKKDEAGNLEVDKLKKIVAIREERPIEPRRDEFESDEDEREENVFIASNRSEVTKIVNKVTSFIYDIKINDIIIIPSSHSTKIAIGRVTSDAYENLDYVDGYAQQVNMPEYELCPFYKRRNVSWHKIIPKGHLDIYLQNALKPQQAISSLNDYSEYIDRNIHDIYIKNDALHSTLRTFQTDDISLSDLHRLISLFYDYYELLSEDQDDVSHPDNIKIKLNIHSPGLIEIIAASSFAIMAIIAIIAGISIHKNGGKFKCRGKDGRLLEFETKGTSANELEKRKMALVEKCLDDPDFSKKVDALKALNLKLPEIYTMEQTDNSKTQK